MKKILITGASGFIGSFIVEEALRRGFETWAAVRATSSRRYLQDSRIRFLELDLQDEEKLTEQLRPHRFDYVVHAAGVTKCSNPADFFRVNRDGTAHLFRAIKSLAMPVERVVFLSSLSVFGAIHERQPYVPITDADQPRPNTCYGRSKLEAERAARDSGLPVRFPYHSPMPQMTRSSQMGALARIHHGRPNSSWMRSLKVRLW